MSIVKIGKKYLLNAADEHCFWVCDGRILRNLSDLKDALADMSDRIFAYHINDAKNDFAKWVEEILKDPVFARKLHTMKSRKTALRSVTAELKKYQI